MTLRGASRNPKHVFRWGVWLNQRGHSQLQKLPWRTGPEPLQCYLPVWASSHVVSAQVSLAALVSVGKVETSYMANSKHVA